MSSVQMAPLTIKDYRLLPEGGPRYQLIEGDLYRAPAPNRFHQDIVGNIYVIIRAYLVKHPRGKVYMAPFDVYLDEINAHQPDILYVSKGNRVLTPAGAQGAPDFVVEVLSRKTAHLDKNPKRRVYTRCGVKEYWIVDPGSRSIRVYYLQDDPEQPVAIYGEDDTFNSPHFPGLKFKGRAVFAE
jgi:Uma2 family endonuclease